MKSRKTTDEKIPFNGSGRHYHRAAYSAEKNWDQWINGVSSKQANSRNWALILGITIAVLGLLGVIIGLIIELS
ncbi:MAG: hypothetical protein KGQ87_07175 [Verrucomicrobia bacterium]|nr:hypothetical protein [Verrucomicrobiota bacterium]